MKRKIIIDDLNEFKREVISKFVRDSVCVKGFLLFSLRSMKFITPRAITNEFNAIKYVLKPGKYMKVKIRSSQFANDVYYDIEFLRYDLDVIGKGKEQFITAIRVRRSNIRNILYDANAPQIIIDLFAFITKLLDTSEKLSDVMYLLTSINYRNQYAGIDDIKAKLEPWTIQNIWKLVGSETVSD